MDRDGPHDEAAESEAGSRASRPGGVTGADLLLAESIPHLVWIAGPDGTVSYYNGRAERYGGIAPIGDDRFEWQPAVHPDDLGRTLALWGAAVERRGAYDCEHRLRMADGSYRWHVSRASLVGDAAADGVWFGTATDVHDLRLTQEHLAEAESRYWAVLSSMDQGYCLCELVLDGTGRPVDYRFLEANDRFVSATGLTDAVGRTAYELIPGLEPQWLETYADVVTSGTPRRFQQHSPAMGRLFDVFATAVEPAGRFALVFSDITQRRALELALVDSEQRFRALTNNLPVIVWQHGPDGGREYVNDTFCDYFGVTRDEVAAGWRVPTHPEDGDAFADDFRRCVAERRVFHREVRVRRADGAWRWIESRGQPQFDADGRYLGHLGSSADVTDRKQWEQSIARLREQEREVSLRLQRALLPDDRPAPAGVELAAAYVAATDTMEVGGDWYEIFDWHDGRVGVVVGDVVGHNLEAAAAMGQLRAGLLALTTQIDAPGELLDALDAFTRRHRVTDFATAVCVSVDPATGKVCHATAGHPPPLLVPPTGPARWLDGASSPPLGIGDVTAREEVSDTVEVGTLLIAYSDGLVERRDRTVDAGSEVLRQLAERYRDLGVERLTARLLDELGADGLEDDTVLVCLRLGPPT
jgi:PAS domain S-box-containing protein